jgi:hypothetical protein
LNGWLDCFRKRAWLICRTRSGESKSVIEEEVGAWKTGVHPSLLREYHPKHAFNAYGFGLLFSLLPVKTCFKK